MVQVNAMLARRLLCCLPCEKGMTCANSTYNTLQDAVIDDGWWRNTLFSDNVLRHHPSSITTSWSVLVVELVQSMPFLHGRQHLSKHAGSFRSSHWAASAVMLSQRAEPSAKGEK